MSKTKEIGSVFEEQVARWESETLGPALAKHPEAKPRFESVSLEEVDRLYSPADVEQVSESRVGFFRSAEARELAHGPDLSAVAGGMNSARVGKLTGERNVAREVDVFDVRGSVETFDLVE